MPGAKLNTDYWVSEYISPCDIYSHGLKRIFVHQQTAFQEMSIVESSTYGKALVLDGKWQSCTGDEFLYHEPLVHAGAVHHRGPEKVLVLGGGEGATVREALKWKTVKKVVMVDIDGEVVEACKKYLPEMHQGAFDDPRTELVIGDALNYLDNSESEWDLIISDLSDPIEEGPSFMLFTKEYFEKCRRALKPNGCFVVQAGPLDPLRMNLHVRLANTVAAVFKHAASYSSFIPTYASPWSFVLASAQPIDEFPDPAATDKLLAGKTTGQLRMFDGRTLLGMFQVGKHVRLAIANETEVYTTDSPPRFFGKGAGSE
ncbi:MAG: methyltransferase domain-containing protein [Sedimentisphaerales bacterium]|nr:methyltransferase domain-containing protein [Sedimentisphaerales bacterium]